MRDRIRRIYITQFKQVEDENNVISTYKTNGGMLIIHEYQKDIFTPPELKRKLLFSKGRIFENYKQIGNYKIDF